MEIIEIHIYKVNNNKVTSFANHKAYAKNISNFDNNKYLRFLQISW